MKRKILCIIAALLLCGCSNAPKKDDLKISIDNFSTFDTTIAGKISNEETTFTFSDNNVHSTIECNWKIYKSLTKNEEIVSKTIECEVGDNTVYLFAEAEGVSKLYTVVVRRREIYNVNFDGYGSLEIEEDHLIDTNSLPIASKIGYSFSSWDYDFSRPVTSNLNIKANWKANEYTITFILNGGSMDASTILKVTYDSQITLPTPIFKGRFFNGWKLDNELLSNYLKYNFDKDITLHADWNNEHFAKLDTNGGYVDENQRCYTGHDYYSCTFSYGESYSLPIVKRNGYSFLRWETVDGSIFPSNGTWEIEGKEIKLFAIWSTKEVYTISYILNGGSQSLPNPVNYSVDSENIYLNDPVKSGEVFCGWFSNGVKISTIKKGSFGNLVLEAKWISSMPSFDDTKFGRFPQTLVEDSATISALNNINNVNEFGYYECNGNEYAKQICAEPYAGSITSNSGKILTPGETYYLKVEPIKWITLSDNGSERLLVSSTVLDCGYYQNTQYGRYICGEYINSNNYAYCSLRNWLNNEFYKNSFTETERMIIKNCKVDNSDGNPTYSFPDTYDNVFLLHKNDVLNDNYELFKAETSLKVSDLAKLKGKYLSSSEHYYPSWYLRSSNYSNYNPATDINYVWWSTRSSKVGVGSASVYNELGGIRPAIRISY